MKFKAAILFECKRPLVIDEISLNPLKEGQVLIKIIDNKINCKFLVIFSITKKYKYFKKVIMKVCVSKKMLLQ